MLVEQADQLALHLAGQDHPDDLHDLRGGDPQAALELAGQAEPAEHRGDLWPAAVDDDGVEAGMPEEGDILGEGALEPGVDHGVAAVLDDDEGAAEALEPRQSLDEGGGLARSNADGGRVDDAAGGTHEL